MCWPLCLYWHEPCMVTCRKEEVMNKPAVEALARIRPYFEAAIAREREKQARYKKEVRGEER